MRGLVQISFKEFALTAKKTPNFTVTKIKWLTLFKEIIAVFLKINSAITNHRKNTKLQEVLNG
jgi:hypothetical protein